MNTKIKLVGGSYFTNDGVVCEFDLPVNSIYPGSVIVVKNDNDEDAAYHVGTVSFEVSNNDVMSCVCYVKVLDRLKQPAPKSPDSAHPHKNRILLG